MIKKKRADDFLFRQHVLLFRLRVSGCHSERSEDELLRTLSEKSEASSNGYQILRIAQDDIKILESS